MRKANFARCKRRLRRAKVIGSGPVLVNVPRDDKSVLAPRSSGAAEPIPIVAAIPPGLKIHFGSNYEPTTTSEPTVTEDTLTTEDTLKTNEPTAIEEKTSLNREKELPTDVAEPQNQVHLSEENTPEICSRTVDPEVPLPDLLEPLPVKNDVLKEEPHSLLTIIISKGYDSMLFKMTHYSCKKLTVPYRLWIVTTTPPKYSDDVTVFESYKDLSEDFVKDPSKWFYTAECGEVFEPSMFEDWICRANSLLAIVPYYRQVYNYKFNENISLRHLDSGCLARGTIFGKRFEGLEKMMLSTDPRSIVISSSVRPQHIGEKLKTTQLYSKLPDEVKALINVLG
jgi:hypothetical protein